MNRLWDLDGDYTVSRNKDMNDLFRLPLTKQDDEGEGKEKEKKRKICAHISIIFSVVSSIGV